MCLKISHFQEYVIVITNIVMNTAELLSLDFIVYLIICYCVVTGLYNEQKHVVAN